MTILSLGATAHADGKDPAAATDLFKEGREALVRGDLATACAKFAESNRLDAKVGTLLNLAQCEEDRRHLVSAVQVWKDAIELAVMTKDARQTVARERAAALEKRIPRLRVELEDAPAGAVVLRDGTPIQLGAQLLVDPGSHEISVSAPGHRLATTKVTLTEGEERTVTMRAGLAIAPPPAAPVARDVPTVDTTRRTLSLALGGVALGAFGVGTWFGAEAVRRNADSKRFCNSDNACDPVGLELRDDARRDARLSTIAFAVGGASLAGAIVLWVTAPRSSKTVAVSVAPFAFTLAAKW